MILSQLCPIMAPAVNSATGSMADIVLRQEIRRSFFSLERLTDRVHTGRFLIIFLRKLYYFGGSLYCSVTPYPAGIDKSPGVHGNEPGRGRPEGFFDRGEKLKGPLFLILQQLYTCFASEADSHWEMVVYKFGIARCVDVKIIVYRGFDSSYCTCQSVRYKWLGLYCFDSCGSKGYSCPHRKYGLIYSLQNTVLNKRWLWR